jgi:gas vesicle protein
MGQDPEVIRREIEETRERMGETVDALGYKTDVKERTKDYVAEKRDAVSGGASSLISKVTGAADSVVSRMPGLSTSSGSSESSSGGPGVVDQTKQVAQRGKGMAQENPLGLGLVGVAAGFVLGLMLPSTKGESERIGPLSDEVKQRAVETGQQALEHGKQIAGEVKEHAADVGQQVLEHGKQAAQEAAQSVKESGADHAQELGETAKDQAQQVAETAKGTVGSGGSESSTTEESDASPGTTSAGPGPSPGSVSF